jgi:alkylation response protein AidB-like acyl-CoA dehydrogenase
LLRYGTEPQRQEFLPRITKGEIFFAIGMSEPDSGSDLASIRTRATPVCGGYEVTGAKVWTSYAHESHYAITLVRTGGSQPADRHRGLSQLIVDLNAKGVSIRPIRNLAGEHDFNEMVLDRVFVPSEMLVGQEGEGWTQVTSELAFERSGPERFLSSHQVMRGLAGEAEGDAAPELTKALGTMAAELWTLRQMSLSVAGMLQAGETPNLEAALVKDLGNAFERAVPERARLLAPRLRRGAGRLEASLADAILYAPSWTLRGGTREILRGIIARGLGLR